MDEQAEQKLEPGHRLDRYELLCPIAQGGMASVWLARQHGKHGFEKLVAVKTILPLYAADLRFQQMFLDEARIASGIEHANVAQILDLGEESDVLYLAMEWVDGDSLSKLFRAAEKAGQMLPVGIVCRIMADTCAGLHAAHDLRDKAGELLNVVHRDISPQNVLVSTRGQAKLIDFGIAKARDRVSENTNTGFLKGKILYMAPEQALGKPVDRRADVWAIGAVMHHMLAGVPPFEGANQLATLHLLVQEGEIPPLPPHVPKPVADVLKRVLVRDIDARVATADELQRLIERAMIDSGIQTLHSDVATFVNEQLKDRVEARRKAVNLALEAAKHRQKLQQMLQPPSPDSSSGVGDLRTRHAATPSGAKLPLSPVSSGSLPSSIPGAEELPSSATLGSGAVVSAESVLSPRGKRLKTVVGSVLAGVVLLGAIALGMVMGRNKDRTPAAAQTPPQPTTPLTSTVTIPPPPPVSAVPATAEASTTSTTTSAPPPPATTRQAVIVRTKPTGTSKPASTSTKTVDDGF